VQAARQVDDRSLAGHLTPSLDPRMLALPPGIRLFNVAVAAWWRAVRVFL